jgi:hypothetical protein
VCWIAPVVRVGFARQVRDLGACGLGGERDLEGPQLDVEVDVILEDEYGFEARVEEPGRW